MSISRNCPNVSELSRMSLWIDRILATLVVVLILGSTLCFGGVVGWFRPIFGLLVFLLVTTMFVRLLLEHRLPVFKSPLTFLAFLVIGLGLLQLIPLPAELARRLSPTAHDIYSLGVIPGLARTDLPTVEISNTAEVRSPVTLDRAATLRWSFWGLACVGVFWSVSHFTDRLKRVYLVWGCVLAAFLINGVFCLVQMAGRVEGLYGYIRTEGASLFTPSISDVLDSPSATSLRRIRDSFQATGSVTNQPAIIKPEEPVLMGTMLGNPGAFLAFGSIALPMGLAILVHMVLPRGSRESLPSRLRYKEQGALVVLLVVLLTCSAFLVGMAAGLIFCLPFLMGMLVVALPLVLLSRRWTLGLSTLLITSLGLGALLNTIWPSSLGDARLVAPLSWENTRTVWIDSLTIFQNFPAVGTGFGSFGAIYPYVKTHAASSNTALSSLLQYSAESGFAGLTLLMIGAIWAVWRLPHVIKQVGTADLSLAYGLIGAAVGFCLWSTVHWSVELPAVAISISALGGMWNRWLAGGTDLFVDCG
jgi:hypothetical protein